MMEQVRISFLVKRTRVNSRGLCPIVGRISSGGESTEISISNPIAIEYWDSVKQRVKSKHPKAQLINACITDVEARFQQLAADLRLQRLPVSPYIIKQRFLGKEKESATLSYIFIKHNEDVRKIIGSDYSRATYLKYELTRNKTLQMNDFQLWRDSVYTQGREMTNNKEVDSVIGKVKIHIHSGTAFYMEESWLMARLIWQDGTAKRSGHSFRTIGTKQWEKLPNGFTTKELQRCFIIKAINHDLTAIMEPYHHLLYPINVA